MRAEGTLTNWAEKTAYAIAVVIDALRGIGHTIKSVIGSFSAVWADIELAGTFLAGVKGSILFQMKTVLACRPRLKSEMPSWRSPTRTTLSSGICRFWRMR